MEKLLGFFVRKIVNTILKFLQKILIDSLNVALPSADNQNYILGMLSIYLFLNILCIFLFKNGFLLLQKDFKGSRKLRNKKYF